MMNKMIENWRGGLIVSCQAPANTPLSKPEIIAAFAETARQNGAVGVRTDSPEHIRAVEKTAKIPILGIFKLNLDDGDVYIKPTFELAREIAEADADIIAIDATFRSRTMNEKLEIIVNQIRTRLKKPLTADVATFEKGVNAGNQLGFDAVFTTLSGIHERHKTYRRTRFRFNRKLAASISVPIVCNGRLSCVADVKRAFDCGAFAVVIGNAITGIEQLVQNLVSATPSRAIARKR